MEATFIYASGKREVLSIDSARPTIEVAQPPYSVYAIVHGTTADPPLAPPRPQVFEWRRGSAQHPVYVEV